MALPQITLDIGGHPLQVEVAVKLKDKIKGLREHTQLSPDTGMLFVFAPPQELRVWMKDTAIPLSLAFLNDQAEIVYLADLEPFSEDVHSWPKPLPFFLETPQGWFSDHNIQVGQAVHIPEQANWLTKAQPQPIGFRRP